MVALRYLSAVAVVVCLAPSLAWGQSNSEVMATVQFNFSNPGARSLALGGAFTARADDATAAYTNPAGLPVLTRSEVSVEGRSWSFSHLFTDSGRAFGPPTGLGVDTVAGLRFGSGEDEVGGLSFLSLVAPVREGKLAVAVYRHETVNFEAAIQSRGAFVTDPENPPFEFRLFPIRSSMDLEMINFGVALGYRVRSDLRIGVGLSLYELDLESATRRYRGPPDDPYGVAKYEPQLVVFAEELAAHDDDVAMNLGLIWEIDEHWNLGAVYRQGPRFDLGGEASAGAALANLELGGVSFQEGEPIAQSRRDFRTPDIYGLGLSYRPLEDLTLTLDYHRIRYSRLTDSIVNLAEVRLDESNSLEVFSFAPQEYRVESGDEIRFGIEYVFSRLRRPLAVRLGSWLDPNHRVEYSGSDARERARWSPGSDEVHVSGGIGYVARSWQLDLAVDFSQRIDTLSLSFVVPFRPEGG